MAANCNNPSNTIVNPIKENLNLLSANFKFLNLKAKRGISETIANDRRTVNKIKSSGIAIKEFKK